MAYVLVVDDDPDACEVCATALGRAGHHVASAPNGRAALAAVIDNTPDVLVLDVRMPEMDGVALLGVIRSYLRWTDLPVIILTALPAAETTRRVEGLGVRRVFQKADVPLADLVDCVTEAAAT